LFLLFDAVGKFIKPAVVVQGTLELGYPESVILPLGIVLLACTLVYLIPSASILGAILLTGYLGGAVATHVRVGNPLFTHTLFPIYVGALVWGGIFLREDRLRGLIPLRRRAGLPSGDQKATASKKTLLAGRIISAIPLLVLLFSSVMKLIKPPEIVQEFGRLGYSESVILGIGILELACMVVYVIPGASVLGAILVTGYFGGAVATHVRIGDPFFNAFMPVLFGAIAWGGLYLRDERLRALIPFRS
jgi:DoxX-like family